MAFDKWGNARVIHFKTTDWGLWNTFSFAVSFDTLFFLSKFSSLFMQMNCPNVVKFKSTLITDTKICWYQMDGAYFKHILHLLAETFDCHWLHENWFHHCFAEFWVKSDPVAPENEF